MADAYETQDPAFAEVLEEHLRMIARVLIARGVTIGAATETLKGALVAAAEEQGDTKPSDSRISLMTGLHRKDVRRLRDAQRPAVPRAVPNVAARAIATWATDSAFAAEGAPRPLSRVDTDDGPGFDSLVRRIKADLAPGTLLQALIEQGAVEDASDGVFRLTRTRLVPDDEAEARLAAYRLSVGAHLEVATANLAARAGGGARFDQAVRHTNLSPQSVRTLDGLAQDGARRLMADLSTEAVRLQRQDGPGAFGESFVCGVYALPSGKDGRVD